MAIARATYGVDNHVKVQVMSDHEEAADVQEEKVKTTDDEANTEPKV